MCRHVRTELEPRPRKRWHSKLVRNCRSLMMSSFSFSRLGESEMERCIAGPNPPTWRRRTCHSVSAGSSAQASIQNGEMFCRARACANTGAPLPLTLTRLHIQYDLSSKVLHQKELVMNKYTTLNYHVFNYVAIGCHRKCRATVYFVPLYRN